MSRTRLGDIVDIPHLQIKSEYEKTIREISLLFKKIYHKPFSELIDKIDNNNGKCLHFNAGFNEIDFKEQRAKQISEILGKTFESCANLIVLANKSIDENEWYDVAVFTIKISRLLGRADIYQYYESEVYKNISNKKKASKAGSEKNEPLIILKNMLVKCLEVNFKKSNKIFTGVKVLVDTLDAEISIVLNEFDEYCIENRLKFPTCDISNITRRIYSWMKSDEEYKKTMSKYLIVKAPLN